MAESEGEMMVDAGRFELQPSQPPIDSQMDYGDQDGMDYHGEDGMMYADGDMMGSDDEGMGHDMGDSYGHEGSPGQYEVRLIESN